MCAAAVICSAGYAYAQKQARSEDDCIIGVNQLHVGVSEADVASLTHCMFAAINATETGAGTTKQVVFYRDYPSWPIAYVYIKNGFVVAIQRRN